MTAETSFLLNVMYPAAQAAYTVAGIPTPDPMPVAALGYTTVGLIQANAQKAAPAMAQATPDAEMIALKVVRESNVFGLVGWNAADSTVIVALRGTEYWPDWVSDLDIPLVPDRSVPSAGMVHMGFQLVYEHIRDSILALLGQGYMGATKIYVTGHSLGGALAVLCGMDLVSNSPVKVVPELHTFAGPRVGDPKFAGSFAGKIPVCFRVVNFMDVVPQVPLPPTFEHVGTKILVHGGFKPLDPVYAHHLTTYKAGLLGLG